MRCYRLLEPRHRVDHLRLYCWPVGMWKVAQASAGNPRKESRRGMPIARDRIRLYPAQHFTNVGFNCVPPLQQMLEDLVGITADNHESHRRIGLKPVKLIAE